MEIKGSLIPRYTISTVYAACLIFTRSYYSFYQTFNVHNEINICCVEREIVFVFLRTIKNEKSRFDSQEKLSENKM